METLVLATHNDGKALEIAALLDGFADHFETAKSLDLPEPEETGTTFAANSLLKARAAAKASGLPALADDSGLSVNALGGAPGIYSARWAGEPRDFNKAMARVWTELQGHEDKSAAFVCSLALVWPDRDDDIIVEGIIPGEIVWPPRGDKGFGYDPIFQPEGYAQTFAEMDPAVKHRISHRARAFENLLRVL